MSGKIGRIGGYFVANAFQAGFQFALVPILVRALGPAEYGRWGLFEPLFGAVSFVALLGTNWGVLKLVNQDGLPAFATLVALVRRGWWIVAIVAGLTGVGVYWQTRDNALAFGFAAVIFFESLLTISLATARASNAVGAFAGGILAKFGSALVFAWAGLSLGLSVVSSANMWILCWCVATGLGALSTIGILAVSMREAKSVIHSDIASHFRSAIAYGWPILAASLLNSVLGSTDRYVLQHFVDPLVLGAYIVTLKVAGAMNLLLMPINLWWPTARFQHIKDADGGDGFFRVATEWLTLMYSTASAGLWLLSPWLMAWFAPGVNYSSTVLALLCLAFALNGLSVPLNVGLLTEGKTHLGIIAVAVASGLQFLLCVALIPAAGAEGAALASLIAFSVNAILVRAMSQRTQPVRLHYGLLGALCLLPWLAAIGVHGVGVHAVVRVSVVMAIGILLGAMLWKGAGAPIRKGANRTLASNRGIGDAGEENS